MIQSDGEQPRQPMDTEQGWRTGGGAEMPEGPPNGFEDGERMAGAGKTASDDHQDNDIDDV